MGTLFRGASISPKFAFVAWNMQSEKTQIVGAYSIQHVIRPFFLQGRA